MEGKKGPLYVPTYSENIMNKLIKLTYTIANIATMYIAETTRYEL